MCGIAGYSLSPRSRVDRTLAAQALLAAIAERGADAVGYAHRSPGARYPTVIKQRTPASKLLERVAVPDDASELLVHVRDFTKGHPSIAANNHPVRHGPVVGIHNGVIVNDDELLAEHPCARTEPEMTVDSEAIFALAAHSRSDAHAFEALHGAMAAAWLDEREPDMLYLARGVARPLWLGECRDGVLFASTEQALAVAGELLRSAAPAPGGRRGNAPRPAPGTGRAPGALPHLRLRRERSTARRAGPAGARLLPDAARVDRRRGLRRSR